MKRKYHFNKCEWIENLLRALISMSVCVCVFSEVFSRSSTRSNVWECRRKSKIQNENNERATNIIILNNVMCVFDEWSAVEFFSTEYMGLGTSHFKTYRKNQQQQQQQQKWSEWLEYLENYRVRRFYCNLFVKIKSTHTHTHLIIIELVNS